MANGAAWRRYGICLIIGQAIFVVTLSVISSHPIPFESSRPFGAALSMWMVGLAWMATRTGISVLNSDTPFAAWKAGLMAEGPTLWRALQIALLVGAAIALQGWAKSMIPHVVPYWADPYLADFEKSIFGTDPWRLLRNDYLNPIYSTLYVSWFLITFGTMGIVAFSAKDQSFLILSFLITLIIGGTVGQYILASGGPIFYEGLGFGPRFHELVATNDPRFNSFASYLWDYYKRGGAGLGTGISAMPSMHIALATWTVFAAREIWRPLTIPAVIYLVLLWGASIASGWHYASDGVVGAMVALAAYRVARRLRPADGPKVATVAYAATGLGASEA